MASGKVGEDAVSLEVIVTRDTATPALTELQGRLKPEWLGPRIGPAAARCVQLHIAGLGQNKKGWPSTHFYEQASDSTRWEAHPEGAIVRVHKVGMKQRYHGGDISPVNKKALAIPISPVSYGHVPSEFPGLFLVKTPKGAYLVQYGDEVGASQGKGQKGQKGPKGGNAKLRQKASLNFLFKLSGGVTQAGDSGVLPSDDELASQIKPAILAALKSSGPSGGGNG